MLNLQPTAYNRQLLLLIVVGASCWSLIAGVGKVHAATFQIEVDAGRENINAIEGVLVLPPEARVENIYTGRSAVLIWVKAPTYDESSRSVTFAGLSPGGFSGKQPIFTLELSGGSLSGATWRDTAAYKNDGEGSPVKAVFSFSESAVSPDDAPPEPFELEVASSPELLDGRYFLSFVAQDKITGIDRYEYRSSWLLTPDADEEWLAVESPLALSKKEYFQKLHVRAVDHEGNFRLQSTAGPYWPITLAIGIIIIVCVALFITRSLPLRSSSSSLP